ncbi:hypothetical protein B484DRAFT_403196 [Ochromonadaceae sp. CCMP2298]|nr:hypothetical protein B484DRAFT_403196 [Ochromonadaceae sp. CCMP2298]
MEYVNSFSQLQQRSSAVSHVSLCAAMDLVAAASEDSLTIYRTLTWEPVFHQRCAEGLLGQAVSALSFSPGGKYLSVGCAEGGLFLLDIEAAQLLPARFAGGGAPLDAGPVLALAWQGLASAAYAAAGNGQGSGGAADRSWVFGGLHQVERAGMQEQGDPNAAEASGGQAPQGELALQLALSEQLQMALTTSGLLHCHVLGVFPLFRLQLQLARDMQLRGAELLLPSPDSLGSPSLLLACSAASAPAQQVWRLPLGVELRADFLWLEQAASLQTGVEAGLARLLDLVAGCGRKWKDALKVVLPKLGLLQGLMDTYQLAMSPLEFCFSISLCGLWHPAAATAFSQHWNEQGLVRLRAAVDSSSRSVIRQLQMRALPIATNALLAARELLAVSAHLARPRAGAGVGAALLLREDLLAKEQLLRCVEAVVLRLDQTLLEARRAREAMLLYVQFVKDCAADVASSSGSALPSALKPDPALRALYSRIFDPRRPRAPSSGPSAQAEHVTGTHLYAHLQDGPAAPIVAKALSGGGGLSGLALLPIPQAHSATHLDAIHQLASSIVRQDMQAHLHGDAPALPAATEGQGQTAMELAEGGAPLAVSLSLLHHIKAAREAAARTCDALHDRLSAQLQRGLDVDGGRGCRLHSSCAVEQRLGGLQCHAAAAVRSVVARVTEEQVWVDVGKNMAGAARSQAVDVRMQSDGVEDEDEEGEVAALPHCLVVASVDADCLLVTLRSLGDGGVEGEAYCYRCSLQSLLDCACRSMEAGGDADASAISGVHPPSAADAQALHVCVYSRASTSGDPCAVSILLSVELSPSTAEDAAPDSESFLLCLALGELRFTRVLVAGSGGGGRQSEDATEEARLVRSAVPQQPLPEGAVRCRRVAMRGVRLLAARGERGVALLSDGAGKTIVLDIEADDEDEDDSDSDGEGEDGEEGEENSEGGVAASGDDMENC